MSKKQSGKNRAAVKTDQSVFIPQRDKFSHEFRIRQRDDLTDRQKEFLKIALDRNTKVVFVLGPAGVSKTFLTVLAVLEMIQTQRLSDLLYIRSVVECSDQKMGFLPGTEEDKMGPYMAPLLDKLDELLEQSDITALQKDNRVSAKPIGFLRGLNWNAKGIIADEAQNFTFNELITLMTRVGQFSKLFICGDLMQSDIAPGKSGLEDIVKIFNSAEAIEQGIYTFEFGEEDIVRSALVKFIVKTVQENIRYVKSKR